MPDKVFREQLSELFPEFHFLFFENMEEAKGVLPETEILVTYGEDVNKDILDQASELKWIMVFSAGLEKIPFKELKRRGILLTNARGIHKIPMAEFAIGLLLMHAKQFLVFSKQQEEHLWNKRVPTKELLGETLLVLGTGAIGREIARYAKFFGMKTIGINRNARPIQEFDETYSLSELNQVLPEADYVLSILPSTKDTIGIFTLEQFMLMKESAVFINLGRGDCIVEEDLLNALEKGEFSHAYLDVFSEEPLRKEHPFWTCNRITITPHVSARSSMYVSRGMDIFIDNLKRYITGREDMINLIDLDRGY